MAANSHTAGSSYGGAAPSQSRDGLSTRPVGASEEIQLRIDPSDLDNEATGLHRQVRRLKHFIAFGFACTPLYFVGEKFIGVHETKSLIKRALARLPIVIPIWFLAIIFPFFGPINSTVGSLLVSFTVYIIPALAHMVTFASAPPRELEGEKIKSPSIMKQDVAQDNTNSYPKKSIPPYMKAVSGSLGGIMEASCLQPIDVIKTRLQLDRSGNYKGILHCGATISRTEGVRALWKGLTPFATHLTLKYALRMGSNAVLQSGFKDSETGKLSNHGRFLSGFGAGVLEAVIIVTPFEVVKIRLQQQRGLSPELLKYKGPVHCARMIIREEGFRGLWAGVSPTIMRNGTNQSAMFTAKNAFDVLLWKKHEGDGKVLQPWQSMISGFLAGTAGPFCTGPFDVVKTRLMAQTGEGGELKYKGMIHAIRTIYAEEGLRALWKGLLPRLMRIPPGQAIMWAVADQVIGLYERRYL